MFEALLSSKRRFGPRPCLGVRSKMPDGTWGSYSWTTYDELYTRVLSVGSALRKMGIEAGESVGLLCDNSVQWVITEQACHAYGFVSVPLWYTVGTSYVEKLINDSGVVAVVCGERWTSAVLRMARDGKARSLRLLVQCEHLRCARPPCARAARRTAVWPVGSANPPPPPPFPCAPSQRQRASLPSASQVRGAGDQGDAAGVVPSQARPLWLRRADGRVPPDGAAAGASDGAGDHRVPLEAQRGARRLSALAGQYGRLSLRAQAQRERRGRRGRHVPLVRAAGAHLRAVDAAALPHLR